MVEVDVELIVVEFELVEEVKLVVVEVVVEVLEELDVDVEEEEELLLVAVVAEVESEAVDEEDEFCATDEIEEVDELLELVFDEWFIAESAAEAAKADTKTITTIAAAAAM